MLHKLFGILEYIQPIENRKTKKKNNVFLKGEAKL